MTQNAINAPDKTQGLYVQQKYLTCNNKKFTFTSSADYSNVLMIVSCYYSIFHWNFLRNILIKKLIRIIKITVVNDLFPNLTIQLLRNHGFMIRLRLTCVKQTSLVLETLSEKSKKL